jgi:hypothetical protein
MSNEKVNINLIETMTKQSYEDLLAKGIITKEMNTFEVLSAIAETEKDKPESERTIKEDILQIED